MISLYFKKGGLYLNEREEIISKSKAITIEDKFDDWLLVEGDLDDFIFYGEERFVKSER